MPEETAATPEASPAKVEPAPAPETPAPAVSSEKPKEQPPPSPPAENKAVETAPKVESPPAKVTGDGADAKAREAAMDTLKKNKTFTEIKAWEEEQKAKAVNKANAKEGKITARENKKKAEAEASLKKKEEDLEKKRADYVEKMKNQIAHYHRRAEEKKAAVEAHKQREIVEIDEKAEKFRVTGKVPKKFGCF